VSRQVSRDLCYSGDNEVEADHRESRNALI
jgi:hypothetical protein